MTTRTMKCKHSDPLCDECKAELDAMGTQGEEELRYKAQEIIQAFHDPLNNGAGHHSVVSAGKDIVQLIEVELTKARLDQLDQLIDINSKTFNQWTQKDIAHFFDVVGKQYRSLEAALTAQLKKGE